MSNINISKETFKDYLQSFERDEIIAYTGRTDLCPISNYFRRSYNIDYVDVNAFTHRGAFIQYKSIPTGKWSPIRGLQKWCHKFIMLVDDVDPYTGFARERGITAGECLDILSRV